MREPRMVPIPGCRPGAAGIIFRFDGHETVATPGASIAAALGSPHGYYCGMGVCGGCVVEIAGVGQRRACMTTAAQGMEVRSL